MTIDTVLANMYCPRRRQVERKFISLVNHECNDGSLNSSFAINTKFAANWDIIIICFERQRTFHPMR
jgi:hypothetical protein